MNFFPPRGRTRTRAIGALTVLAMCVPLAVYAELAAFQTTINGNKKNAVLEEVSLDGTAYVSLTHLIDQLGGGSTILPTRVQLDLTGITAWVRIDGTAVNASLSRFSLKHPIRRHDGKILIARDDAATLFSRAFRLSLRRDTRLGRRTPVRTTENRPVVVEDLIENKPSPTAMTNSFTLRPEERRAIGRIVIDPGHGGYDRGVEGPAGALEKDLTLAVARILETFLEKSMGVDAILTRDVDTGLTPEQRAKIGNESESDLFISLHTGASFSQNAQGFEVFHPIAQGASTSFVRRRGVWESTPNAAFTAAIQSKEIAQWIEKALIQETASPSRGIHASKLRFFSEIQTPGLLIELGCLTNPREEALLETESYQTKLARAISNGIKRYLAAVGSSGFRR